MDEVFITSPEYPLKSHSTSPACYPRPSRWAAYSVLLLWAVVNSLSAQEVSTSSPAADEPENVDARDFLADTQSFIAGRKSQLLMASQEKDIFGRAQDLNKPKPVPVRKRLAQAAPVKPRVPLEPLLAKIPITLLDTASKRVLLDGGATLRVGEIVDVAFRGSTVRLRLDAVRSQGAYFRNMENGDLGLATLRSRAEGISRDSGGGSREGIQRINQNTPRTLNLDGAGLAPPGRGISGR